MRLLPVVKVVTAVAVAAAMWGCVPGSQVRADADVIKADIERARRSGAMRCAPVELATAEAKVDFALGDLTQGQSFLAGQEIHEAEESAKRALELSRGCAPKQILVKESTPAPTEKKAPPVVIRIEQTDRDHDGIPDVDDKCPDEAGIAQFEGCADPDPDHDGVAGADDKCPNQAGPATNGGCPEGPVAPVVDRDNDGVPDAADKCPDQPEDRDGFQDDDGCPDPDNDGDGLVDAHDKCPNVPGDIKFYGCPIQDRDADGVTDDIDKCPDQSGPATNGGCPVTDRDGDGIPDDQDKCPDEAGDAKFKGCADPDRDHDGIPNAADKCPDEKGPPENFGCADTDKDGDGIPDRLDKCPTEPEDKDGFEDTDGCPDLDNDQDGIPDKLDKCPNQSGPAEAEGCPDPDSDKDGIPDRLDKCPNEYGVKDEGGCPKQYKLVVVKKDRIEIKQQIKFKSGSGKVIGSESFEILREVADALKDNAQIKKLRIEGHTDNVGRDSTNLRLSQARADSVMASLIRLGIDPGRLEAVGFGSTKPIASNKTRSGRAENRRTEFNIVEQ